MRILNECHGIAKSQSPPSGSVDAELRMHAAYNHIRDAAILENSFQVRAQKRIRRRLANSDVAWHYIQASGELPCGCAVLEITGLRFVLNEDDRSAGISSLARDTIDAADNAFTIESLSLAFAKALLNIDDE